MDNKTWWVLALVLFVALRLSDRERGRERETADQRRRKELDTVPVLLLEATRQSIKENKVGRERKLFHGGQMSMMKQLIPENTFFKYQKENIHIRVSLNIKDHKPGYEES